MNASIEKERSLWISIHTPMGQLTSVGLLPLTELELVDHWHKLALIENSERDWVRTQIGDIENVSSDKEDFSV